MTVYFFQLVTVNEVNGECNIVVKRSGCPKVPCQRIELNVLELLDQEDMLLILFCLEERHHCIVSGKRSISFLKILNQIQDCI